MKYKNILVTGGAGFIGSHLVDSLIDKGFKVTILDNLDKQVHQDRKPQYLNKKARFIKGDVTNYQDLKRALKGIDCVYHEAAVVGVGQSMYEIDRYIYNNSIGTARLLDFIVNNKNNVRRIFIASSMSAYGEGLYYCKQCGKIRPSLREDKQMSKKHWELKCPNCQKRLVPIATPETEKFACNSIYAISKQSQEDMVINIGKAYKIPVTAFRYFNVYGSRQSLSNPYTGVTAIFLSRLKNSNQPVIYEDGHQTRDFISVYDIVEANILALENQKTFGKTFNLGNGKPIFIKDIALILSKLLGKKIIPKITKKFRSGDVRHCFADISLIKSELKWSPKWSFEEGMKDLIKWSEKAEALDLFEVATKELKEKGLVSS